MSLITLQATVAMRREDARIARKHATEAAARTSSPASVRAYRDAIAWSKACDEAERVARAALIARLAPHADAALLPCTAR